MNQFTQRHYQALMGYLKSSLQAGTLQDGSRLPSEELLAQELSFSVPSLREAMHLLEIFGLLTPDVDGSYRLSHEVSRGFTDILSMMLLMDQIDYADVNRLRRSMELQSLPAICAGITESQKQTLYLCLMRMMASPHGDRKADAEFHDVLLSASRDKLVISLNRAMAQFMGPRERTSPDEYNFENWDELVQIHMQLYQAVVNNQPTRAAEAVYAHYDFLEQSGASKTSF